MPKGSAFEVGELAVASAEAAMDGDADSLADGAVEAEAPGIADDPAALHPPMVKARLTMAHASRLVVPPRATTRAAYSGCARVHTAPPDQLGHSRVPMICG
jgi:hypothetical protein